MCFRVSLTQLLNLVPQLIMLSPGIVNLILEVAVQLLCAVELLLERSSQLFGLFADLQILLA